MSLYGRTWDALDDLWEYMVSGSGETEPGPAQLAGITHEQWRNVLDPIMGVFVHFEQEVRSRV